MKKIVLLQLLLTMVFVTNSQTLDLSIVEGTNFMYDDIDIAYSTDFDKDGNVYLAGKGYESIVFGVGEPNETELVDGICVVAKYTKSGNLVWAKEMGNQGNGMTPYAIKVSKNGDIYLVGSFYNEAKIHGTNVILTGEKFVAFVVKLNSSGDYLWSKTIDGSESETAFNLFIDKDENIFVGGNFQDTVLLGKGEPNEKQIASRGHDNVFIAKYSKAGNFLWGTEIGSSGYTNSIDFVQLDSTSFYHVSNFYGNAEIGDHNTPDTIITEYYQAGLIVKYKLNGEFVFASKQGIDIMSATGLNDKILISGRFTSNTSFFNEAGFINLPNISENYNSNFFIASIKDNGYANWIKGIYSDGYEQGLNLAADKNNHFYLTATFDDKITLGQNERNEITLAPVGGNGYVFANFFVAGFSENGDFLWANHAYGGGGYPYDLKSDDKGNTYLAGSFTESLIIKSGETQYDTLVALGKSDLLITRFNPYFNYPPNFSVSGNHELVEDFSDTLVYNLLLDSIPANEINQITRFSLDSVSGNLVNYEFDNTGILKISSKQDLNGEQVFYFSADDGGKEDFSAYKALTIKINPVNDVPIITGLVKELTTDEDTPISLTVSDLVITDPDNVFPDDFKLTIYPGENYTFENATITTELNFSGFIQVSSTVSDVLSESLPFFIDIAINSVNDIPEILSVVDTLSTLKNTPIELILDYFTVNDPDNNYPDDFEIIILDGNNYTFQDATVIPANEFLGDLSINIQLSDGNDVSETTVLNINVFNIVGILDAEADAFLIIPNPFKNEFTIKLNSEPESGRLSIYNISGDKIYASEFNETKLIRIDLSELPAGLYFVHLTNQQNTITKKIVKQ